jgi:serine/threonine protein phosphatase PrpC
MGRAIKLRHKHRRPATSKNTKLARNASHIIKGQIQVFNKDDWKIALSRCQGASHVADNTPCQDQVHALMSEDTVIIALADGAGSARFSHFGADLAVRRASALIAGDFDKAFKLAHDSQRVSGWIVSSLLSELNRLAESGVEASPGDRARLALPSKEKLPRIPSKITELSSTLLLVAVKGERYIALHIGDGVLGIETETTTKKHRIAVLSHPDNGEFANETQFIISSNAISCMNIFHGRINRMHSKITGFILMSDGTESALYNKSQRTLVPACSKLFQSCRILPKDQIQPQLTATLRKVIATKTNDDCSIALISR